MCVLCFRFQSKSLVFKLNPGHYMPNSLCSSPNGLLFMPKYFFGNVRLRSVLSICHVWWGVLKNYFLIVDKSGTKYHCVNPLPIFEHNYVNVFEKYWCIKTFVLIRVVTRYIKAHYHQNNSLFYNIIYSICLLFLVFELWFFRIVKKNTC